FYNHGGGEDSHKDIRLKPLHLSAGEKQDLIAFLLALSGDPLTTSEHVWIEKYPTEYPAIEDWRNVPN
ncbi:MAG: hypothetical protein KAH77_07295, partial [Thiomargarita sp.]|nr:hypothetical protein [Thiomargarita sp.]